MMRNALHFTFSIECWRMACWTCSLIVSHLQLFLRGIFSASGTSFYRLWLTATGHIWLGWGSCLRPFKGRLLRCSCHPHKLHPAAYVSYMVFVTCAINIHIVSAGRSSRLLSKKMMDIKGRNRDAQLKAFEVDKESVAGKCYSTPKQYPYYVYEYSKLCLLLFSYELHRQLGLMDKSCLVSVNAVDPGAVKTNIMRELPSSLSFVAFMVLKLLGLLHSPENAVNSILDAALATPEVSGIYYLVERAEVSNLLLFLMIQNFGRLRVTCSKIASCFQRYSFYMICAR